MIVSKYIKYTLLLVVVALLAYKSVYFKKLSEVKRNTTGSLMPLCFTKKLWDEKLPPKLDSAIELTTLIKAISADPNAAFETYTNAMAVGNYRYAMVKTTGKVVQVNEDDFSASITLCRLFTEYKSGN
jgi:hypothetical protein